MKPVADTHHLQKRGDHYTFYRRVPKRLVPALGRTFIKKALGVTSLAEAKKLRAIEEIRADALFAAAEKGDVGSGAGTVAKPVSMAILTEHVREAVEKLDKRAAQRAVNDPPESAKQASEVLEHVEQDLQALRDPADPNAHSAIQTSARQLAAEKGLDVDQAEFPKWEFFDFMRRGLIELQRRKLGRYNDDHSQSFYDALFDPKQPPAVTFGELADAYVDEKAKEYWSAP